MVMKYMMEPGETLVLSYGFGIFRIVSDEEITLDSESVKTLCIVEMLKLPGNHWVGIAPSGHEPSKMEMSIYKSTDFKLDKEFCIKNGSESMKNRFSMIDKLDLGA